MALDEAVTRYQEALTPEVVEYLEARGLNERAIVTSRVGVVSDPHPGHGRYVGWLSIPYLRHDGQAVGVRFRCLEDHDHREYGHGKYMSLPDEPVRVYGIPVIHDAKDEIHIAEGELDSLILRQVGMYAIAIPGAQAWRSHHRRMLAGFSRVWVWGDPDDAGAEFITKVCRSMRRAKGVSLDRNIGDVTDHYLEGVDLLALIES